MVALSFDPEPVSAFGTTNHRSAITESLNTAEEGEDV